MGCTTKGSKDSVIWSDESSPEAESEKLLPRMIEENMESKETLPWYCINKQMIPSKFAYYFEYAKEGSHWQYLVLFYVNIGLDPSQAGLISGLRFIGGFLGAPIFGWIADKYGHHRKIAIFVCFLAAITSILQPIVSRLFGDPDKNRCPRKSSAASSKAMSYSTTNNMTLFYSLLFVSTITSFFDGTTMGFVDSGVLRNILASSTPIYIGMQRYFGPVGLGVSAFVSSLFIEYFPRASISCYTGIFVNYFLACAGMAITFHFLLEDTPLCQQEVDRNINQSILVALRRVDVWVFFAIVFFNGMALALAFSFSFLFLAEMNASNLLLGLSMCVNGVFGAIFYMISDPIINFIGGSMYGMAFSCFFWSIRYLLLALMNQPYQFLYICTLNGLTCSLFVASYVEYIKHTFPLEMFTVICGFSSSLYNCGGYLAANIIGGVGYKYYGVFNLFLLCCVTCAFSAALTFIYAFILNRKKRVLHTKYPNQTKDQKMMVSK